MRLSEFDCGKIVNLGQYWLLKPQLGECAGWAEVNARASVPASLAASDWSIVIISTLPFSLTWSRGEYIRVVGILEMVE